MDSNDTQVVLDAAEMQAKLAAIMSDHGPATGPLPVPTPEEIRAREEEEFWANAGYEYSRMAPYLL